MSDQLDIPRILATYRRELELEDELKLKVLVEHYGLQAHDKPSCIDALVEHFRRQLLKEGK